MSGVGKKRILSADWGEIQGPTLAKARPFHCSSDPTGLHRLLTPRMKLHWNVECRMSIDEWRNRFALPIQ
ncbi:hypothetical protein D1AOALGA4SA_12233 [Olavius algarvensis Delta 1 endosymbiont]|nr:hypothetical protein D1AOALGA4SA_12233 [Olavius algarvensis Delta 1 endosymbiont]